MIKQEIKITNRLGLHARPAAQLVQTAAQFNCDIKITKDQVQVNAKSIMGVMMLAAEYGSCLHIQYNGTDEKQAAQTLQDLFENKFNEEF